MRSFALGVLRHTPDQFGRMRIGHMLEAMSGYQEAQGELLRSHAELLRTGVTILWNVQVKQEDRLMPAQLWPMSWDKEVVEETMMPEEELNRVIDAQKQYLENMFGGN